MTDHKIYAIGDIHGHPSALDNLLALIEEDAAGEPYQLVFVGDYIDRGPDSKGVIDRLIELQQKDWKYPPVFLEGNHEQTMKLIVSGHGPQFLLNWGVYGARQTFQSYGLDPSLIPDEDENGPASFDYCKSLSKTFAGVVGEKHREFLNGLVLSYSSPTHFFCHAGVNFDAPLDEQRKDDLLNIRRSFLESTQKAEKIIVHGHSITKDRRPEIHPNRIAIDTGVFLSDGYLTACVLRAAEPPKFLMANKTRTLEYP